MSLPVRLSLALGFLVALCLPLSGSAQAPDPPGQPQPDQVDLFFPQPDGSVIRSSDIVIEFDPSPTPDVDEYRIYRGTDPNTSPIDTVLTNDVCPGLPCTYVDDTAVPFVVYRYAVTAIDAVNGESDPSPLSDPFASDNQPPDPPLNLQVQVTPEDDVQLFWTCSQDGFSNVGDYQIFRGPSPIAGLPAAVACPGGPGTQGQYVDDDPPTFTPFYKVHAVDTRGNVSAPGQSGPVYIPVLGPAASVMLVVGLLLLVWRRASLASG